MVCIQMRQRVVNLLALAVRPRLLGKLGGRLHRHPTAKCTGRQNQSPPAARPAHDPAPRSVKGRRTPRRRHLATLDAAIERRRETKQRKSSNLEAQQGLFDGRAFVERSQEPHRNIEHDRLGLVIRHALTNDGQCCTRRPNRLQTPKDLVKRSVDRHMLQVRELAAARPEVRVHQDVGLQRTAKPTLTLSSAASKCGDLAVLLC